MDTIPAITILITEDNAINAMYLEALFLEYNCTVLEVMSGEEAIEIVKGNTTIDIILMDLKMSGIGGISAIEEIRKINATVPIIIQTGVTSNEEKQAAFDAGCNDYIVKPFSKEDIFKLVNKQLK